LRCFAFGFALIVLFCGFVGLFVVYYGYVFPACLVLFKYLIVLVFIWLLNCWLVVLFSGFRFISLFVVC